MVNARHNKPNEHKEHVNLHCGSYRVSMVISKVLLLLIFILQYNTVDGGGSEEPVR